MTLALEILGRLTDATRQPDALYLLVQKCCQLQQALNTSQQQIEQLRQEQTANKNQSNFFGSNAWGTQPTPSAPQAVPATSRTGHGWLGNIASTAAGVAAGAFLFEGVQQLFGHHDNNHFLGESAGREETVINNFFEAPSGQLDNSGDFANLSDGLDDNNEDPWV